MKRVAIVAGGVGATIALIAIIGVLRSEPGYVGTTERVDITWRCWNFIDWTDPATDEVWTATASDARSAEDAGIEYDPSVTVAMRTYRVQGLLRFTSADRASLESAAGGTLTFIRLGRHTVRDGSCAGPPPGF